MKPMCTVYTDASVCPHTKASAWGAWIKFEGRSYEFGAPFKEDKESVGTAEMAAMACGIFKGKLIVGAELPGTLFVVVSDCQEAITKMKAPGRCRTKEEREIETFLRFDAVECGYRMKFNKVKGHRRLNGPRGHVNHVAHKLALAEMRKLRAARS